MYNSQYFNEFFLCVLESWYARTLFDMCEPLWQVVSVRGCSGGGNHSELANTYLRIHMVTGIIQCSHGYTDKYSVHVHGYCVMPHMVLNVVFIS